MTPKEKADQLFDKCLLKTIYKLEGKTWRLVAKQCALIAVDEILDIPKIASFRRDEVYMELEYWHEVKQEIEKL
mgnify:CR=1 FL=1